jgi:D-hexose-6-phosphate mutarotase
MNDNLDSLNQEYALQNHLIFKQLPSGIVIAQIDTPLATAIISLHGGQVVEWRPKHQETPVLWVSKLATFTPGRAIRGGVPICWPWFGIHPTNSQLPGHGYARISSWDIAATEHMNDGAIRVRLTMQDSEMSLAHFPRSVGLAVQITVGSDLTVELTTTNESNQDIVLTEGLHTYFKVSDVSAIEVQGLEGTQYVDLIRDSAITTQEGPILFDGELGRVFTNSSGTCVIEDQGLGRSIVVSKRGSLSTAVWNPGAHTANKIVDFGEDEWREMVCVEGANALENFVTVKSGAAHTHTAIYSTKPIG